MGVDPVTGKLTQHDFFVPVGYAKLNSGDKDFSSSGVTLLDPVTFSGAGAGTNRVAVAGSKVGTIYVLDADNLGGYMNGPGKTNLRKCSRLSKPNLDPPDTKKFCKRSFSGDHFTMALEVTHWKVVTFSKKAPILFGFTSLTSTYLLHH